MKNVVITGGTGTVGKLLCDKLSQKGYAVFILTRSKSIKISKQLSFVHWDISNGHIDKKFFPKGEFALMHLAGASVIENKWTEAYKQSIYSSRIDSIKLILEKYGERCTYIASASGSNYYFGPNTETYFEESDPPNTHYFLGRVCKDWEKAALKNNLNIPAAVLRTGTVLAQHGGAFAIWRKLANYFMLMPLGTGKQFVPWIHVEDLCEMYVYCLEHQLTGAFNAVADEQIRHEDLLAQIASTMKRPLLPNLLPNAFLKLILGKRAKLLLNGAQISNDKIQQAGFKFRYPKIKAALGQLLTKS